MASTASLIGVGKPLVGWGDVFGLARSVVSAHTDAALAGWTSGLSRMGVNESNAVFQNLYPGIAEAIGLFYQNRIDDTQLKSLLEAQGCDYEPVPVIGEHILKRSWRAIVGDARPRFSPQDYLRWNRQGRLAEPELAEVLRQQGLTGPVEREMFLGHFENMPLQAAVGLWYRGIIDDAKMRLILRAYGFSDADAAFLFRGLRSPVDVNMAIAMFRCGMFDRDQAKAAFLANGLVGGAWQELFLTANTQRVSNSEALVLFNRGEIEAGTLDDILRFNGVERLFDRQKITQLAKAIPGPSDLVMFSVREVWNPPVVARFGYDDEFPAEFQYWMKKQGYDWTEDIPVAGGPAIPGVPWPKAYWRAHWQTISPQMAYEMYHRFRGDPANPATWSVPGIRPFTIDDVRTVLKIADYPPALRDQLAALSFSPLRLFDIRAGVTTGLQGRDWAIGKYLDRGNSPDNAAFLADLAIKRREEAAKKRELAEKEKAAREVIRLYHNGFFTEDEAAGRLVDLGWDLQAAKAAIAAQNYKLMNETIEQGIAAIKRDWMGGRTSAEEALQRMQRLGVRPEHASQLITRFINVRGESRVMASSSRVIDWYKAGLMDQATATQRLLNLGWTNVDALLAVAKANRDVAIAQQKLAASELQRQNAAAKTLQQNYERLQAAVRSTQARMRAVTPVATLKKWVVKGIISCAEFVDRLIAAGFEPAVANDYLRELGIDNKELKCNGQPAK